jgi:hypothetical protein
MSEIVRMQGEFHRAFLGESNFDANLLNIYY